MISSKQVVSKADQNSFVTRNGGSGTLQGFYISQTATGTKFKEVENSWLVAKGGTGVGLDTLWGTYLASKGFTVGSLRERMRAFFRTGSQA